MAVVLLLDPDRTEHEVASAIRRAGHVVLHVDTLDRELRRLFPDAGLVPAGAAESLVPALRELVGPRVPIQTTAAVHDGWPPGPVATRELAWLGEVAVDLRQRLALRPDGVARLTDTEADLLGYLWARPGEVVDREQLLEQVWGYGAKATTRTIDTTVARLRRKIEPDPARRILVTVHGAGYRLDVPERRAAVARVAPGESSEPDAIIGRRDELHRLSELVARSPRVVVVGPPGVGKSTLVRAFADLEPSAARIDLAGVTTAAQALEALALGLGVLPSDLPERLAAPSRQVVVVDHVDTLLDELLSALGEVMSPQASLRIVIVSRLSPSDPEIATLKLDVLSDDAACALLRRVGRSLRPTFAPPGNDDVLLELANALDRLPLALVLAGSRARVMSVVDLLPRVRDGIAVLTTREPGLDTRHRSVRVALEESWSALSGPLRQTAARLSVFAGSFDIGAAESIAGPQAPEHLERLVESSLVVSDVAEDAGIRFRLLHVIESFLSVALEAMGEAEAIGLAHARWYRDVGLSRLPVAWGPGADAALAAIERDRANTLVALERTAPGHPDLAGELALCVGPLAEAGLRPDSAARWCRQLAPRVSQPALASALWFRAADAALVEGTLAEARAASAACLAAAEAWACGDPREPEPIPDTLARAHLLDGVLATVEGRASDATGALDRASELASHDAVRIAVALARVRRCLRDDDTEGGLREIDRASALADAQGSPWQRLDVHGTASAVHLPAGRIEDALREVRMEIELRRPRQQTAKLAYALANAATCLYLLGAHDESRAHAEEARDLLLSVGQRRLAGLAIRRIAATHRAQGHLDAAMAEARRAVQCARSTGGGPGEARATLESARIALRQGQASLAVADATRALQLADSDPGLGSCARLVRGLAHDELGRREEALADLTAGLEVTGQPWDVERAERERAEERLRALR